MAPEDMEYEPAIEKEKDIKRFIDRTEKIIRGSKEYKDYVAFVKEYMDMDKCAFFTNVRNGEGGRVRIEIHHEPFTLYDIVESVFLKYRKEGIEINDLYIADEVLKLHYDDKVGLIPLSRSIHQIVHFGNGQIIVPIQLVYGGYRDFVDEYAEYNDRLISKLDTKIMQTKTIKSEMIDSLTPSYTYLEVDGFTLPVKFELADAMTNENKVVDIQLSNDKSVNLNLKLA